MFLADGRMDGATDNAMHQSRHEADGYRRIEVITGAARRRRWTAEEKAAMIAESLRPGVNISELARRCGVNRGLLQTWRRMAVREAEDRNGVFVPLRIEDASATADTAKPASQSVDAAPADSGSPAGLAAMQIEAAGLRVRFTGPIDAAALRLVLAHVGRRA
jgi:transposase